MRQPDPTTEFARQVTAVHAHAFYRASCLLPPKRRPAVWALYAFARTTDDIVDSCATSRSERAAALRQWRRHITQEALSDRPPNDPVALGLWRTIRSYRLDWTLFEEFFESMEMDLSVTRYSDRTQLNRYMRGSAAVVGEWLAPVLGADQDAVHYAAALGEAFQLTNFLRDIAEDWRLGRVYLPQDELARFGVTDDDLDRCVRHERVTAKVAEALAAQTAITKARYEEAAPGIALLDARARPSVRAAFQLYREILLAIEDSGYQVFSSRVRPGRGRRLTALGRALVGRPR
jgi:phytoene synthase